MGRIRYIPPFFLLCVIISANAQNTNWPPAPPTLRYQTVTADIQLHHLSPVEYFRGLLGMAPAERNRVLALKSPEDKRAILAKVQEYEALPRDIREARLRQTELRWELTELMRLPAGERAKRLKEIPVLDRPMVDSSLRQWDELPATVRNILLEKETFISVYLRLQRSAPESQKEIIARFSPDRHRQWTEEMVRWQTLPEQQRGELCHQFERFFYLNDQEQKRTVDGMSDSERHEMENALHAYAQLPLAQRKVCVESFGKFATLSSAQQGQFLQNAAHWDAMTSGERQLWRQLVQKLPPMPPMPPHFPSDMPPLPPGFHLNFPPTPGAAMPTAAVNNKNDVR